MLTGDKERTRDLGALRNKAAEQHPRLADALPKTEPEDERLFGLLRKAYIDARSSKSYRISLGELATLYERVLELARRVREACLEKLATFGGPTALRSPLPEPPALDEPLLASLPPPPDEPAAIAGWARGVAELAEAGVREGLLRVRIEGLREGEARGKEEGLREGEARGKQEGLREGKVAALRTVLAARGVAVDDEARGRIEACDDVARLDRWLARALTAASAREALDDGSEGESA